jgi:hypothetical protein
MAAAKLTDPAGGVRWARAQLQDGRPGWRIGLAVGERLAASAMGTTIGVGDRRYFRADNSWWIAAGHERRLLAVWPQLAAYFRQPELPGLTPTDGDAAGPGPQ